MVNDNVTQGIYIVCLIVIACFAIAFLSLSYLYFRSKKLLYVNGFEDVSINKEITKDLPTLKKKAKEEKLSSYFAKRGKASKTTFSIWNIILFVIYAFAIAIVGVSLYSHFTNTQVFFGNNAMLVIETNSMESVNPVNTYISENGLKDDSNRIEHYSFITIEKVDPSEMKLYDVYAFRMFDIEKNEEITVVHRLIAINNDNGNITYTFRGDANPNSLTLETEVGFDYIVGRYTGYKNVFLGYFLIYLRSSIGLITLAVALLLLVIYSLLYSKLVAVHDDRYLHLLKSYDEVSEEDINFIAKVDDSVINFTKISDNEYSYNGQIQLGSIEISGVEGLDIQNDNFELVLSSPSRNMFDIVSYQEEYEFNKQVCYLLNPNSKIEFIADANERYDILLKDESPYKNSSKKMLFLYCSIHRGNKDE